VALRQRQRDLLVMQRLAALALALCATSAAAATHPLDPLSTDEIAAAVRILRAANLADDATLYPRLALDVPAKSAVLRWRPGDPVARSAFAVLLRQGRLFEARIDLTAGRLDWSHEIAGVQPGLLPSEDWSSVVRIVYASSEWQRAVRARGVQDLRSVVCVPLPIGDVAADELVAARLVKVICFDGAGVRNYWARPLEGLVAIVDLHAHQLRRVIDTGVVPVPRAPADLPVSAEVGAAKSTERAGGGSAAPSFEVEDHIVRWRHWSFHYRLDPRVGLTLSTVTYRDGGRERPVIYEASLSELFVPYMDPDESWYFRSFLDAGEHGIGQLAVSLEPGRDCPAGAATVDAVFADDWGEPYVRPRAACVFEREAGDVAWRHTETASDPLETATQPRTELVLRQISAVGNYDYVFDWAFRPDGSIEVVVGATGIPQVKAVREPSAAGAAPEYGRFVAGHTVAVNHDHFFCFRLDMDVDGPRNTFLIDRLMTKRLVGHRHRTSLWRVQPEVARMEADGRLRMDMDAPALWRVVSADRPGPLGYPPSYELVPGHNAAPLVDADDATRRRAGFTAYQLWVTPYADDERYAAGAYPNQGAGGAGLPAWTTRNRSINSTDIVLWYTFGFHHVVRAEDWPVVPTKRHGFELRPFDFFRRNPTLDPDP
jgi:primary-amine oxidase